jgi:hypothetical protein
MRRLIAACAGLLLFAAPAFAQKPRPPQAPPAAEAPAPAPDAAARLIAGHGMEDVFEPVADDFFIAVRHRLSGFVCRFEPGPPARLIVFPGLERGEDVGCDQTTNSGEIYTFYVTRYPPQERFTAEDQMNGSMEIMLSRYPNAEIWAPPFEIALGEGAFVPPETFTGRLIYPGRDRQRYLTRVSIAQVGPWSLKMRYSAGPIGSDGPEALDMGASLIWGMNLIGFARDNPTLAI